MKACVAVALWADQQVAEESTVEFYQAATCGEAPWARLYMVPGMAHCQGGESPDEFDPLTAMEHWAEDDDLPQQILASHRNGGKVDRTRPLCPYPQVAQYQGKGSPDEAKNFGCTNPQPR